MLLFVEPVLADGEVTLKVSRESRVTNIRHSK